MNSPNQFRTLILYQISQWKTIDKSYESYEKLCVAMKKEAISYDNYEYWFNRYLKENYYSARDGRTHRVGDLQVGILADVVDGRSTENSYKSICDAFGIYKIDEKCHENLFRICGFEAFQDTLNNAEKPIHSYSASSDTCNAKSLSFCSFPEDVITEIVDRCDLKSYLNLRDLSHSLRTIVDKRPPPCTDIDIIVRDDYIHIKANNEILVDSCPIELTHFRHRSLWLIEKRVFRDLEALLKNPKLRLKSFRFDSNSSPHHTYWNNVMDVNAETRNYYMLFLKMLEELNHRIHVERCSIKAARKEDVILILKRFKPGTLQKLELNNECLTEEINKIVEMDQWKRAIHAQLDAVLTIPIKNFFHFMTFDASFGAISMNDLGRLCENLSQSIKFKNCYIATTDLLDIETIKNALTLRPSAAPGSYYIPNSNLVIQFSNSYGSDEIIIQKL